MRNSLELWASNTASSSAAYKSNLWTGRDSQLLGTAMGFLFLCLKFSPLSSLICPNPPLFPLFHFSSMGTATGSAWKEWDRGLLVPAAAGEHPSCCLEEHGERQFVLNFWPAVWIHLPVTTEGLWDRGLEQRCRCQQTFFEPTVPLCKGGVCQSTPVLRQVWHPRLWVTPVFPSGERKPLLVWICGVIQVLMLNSAQVLQKSLQKIFFFPILPPFPLPSPSHPHIFHSYSPRQGHFGPQGWFFGEVWASETEDGFVSSWPPLLRCYKTLKFCNTASHLPPPKQTFVKAWDHRRKQ